MKHIVITRCNFDNDELFEKYFKIMESIYFPAIKSQINKNFEIAFLVTPTHSEKISKIDLGVKVNFFSNIKLFNQYCVDENIEIQTRHDCDDWMRYDYIDEIQKLYLSNCNKYETFLIQSQIYKFDINNDKLYKPKLEYHDKNTSMFLSLCQKSIKYFVLDDNHRFMYKVAEKVLDLGYGFVKLVIHGNNKLSTILSGDVLISEKKPDISIIIPTFNNINYIDECIESLIKSCGNINFEILVGIDNCAKTHNHIIKKYNLDESNIKFFFFSKNIGPYVIKNSLIHKTNSDNILFFDSDDIIKNGAIRMILKNLSNHQMVRFRFENFYGSINNFEHSKKCADGVFAIKKQVFLNLNGYEPWICGADSEIVWRIESNNYKIKLINDSLFHRRIHNNNLTVKKDTNDKSVLRITYRKIFNDKKSKKNYKPLQSLSTHPNERILVKKEMIEPIGVNKNTDETIIVLSTLWNASRFIPQFVSSIKTQTYKNFKVIVVDDNSSDKSFELLKKLTDGDRRFTIIKNNTQKFKTQNFYEIIHNYSLINDNDIIVELDGDDSFYNKNVLETVRKNFNDNIWIAGYKWIDNRGKQSPFRGKTNADNPRSLPWTYSAMRVFRAFLFRNINKQDLMFKGEFVRAANDVTYGMPMLEMAGNEHYHHSNEITYLYNWHSLNTHTKSSSIKNPNLQKEVERHIYSLPRYKKLETRLEKGVITYEKPVRKERVDVPNNVRLNNIKKIVSINKKPEIVEVINYETPIKIEPSRIAADVTSIKESIKKLFIGQNPDDSNEKIKVVHKVENQRKIGDVKKIKEIIGSEFIKHSPDKVQTKTTVKVLDENKLKESEIKNNHNFKIMPEIKTTVVKPQNKKEIDKRRKEFENIFLYGPKGKKEISPTPPKSIGVNI